MSAISVTAVPIPPTKRGLLYMLWLGIALAIGGGIALAALTSGDFLTRNARQPGVQVTPSGLQYKVLKPGEGPRATDSDILLINYEGRLLNGTVFDKSQRPTPFSPREVVPGFAEGLKLTQRGGKYRFWIKPELGYKSVENGPIPANSTLVFDVEVLGILPESVVRAQMQQQMLMQQQQMPQGAPPPQP